LVNYAYVAVAVPIMKLFYWFLKYDSTTESARLRTS